MGLIVMWVGFGFFAQATNVITQDEALDLARQEQILVARLLKDIVLIGSNFLHKDVAQKDKKKTIELFMQNLKKLKTFDTSKHWQVMMKKIEQQGQQSKAFADLQPDPTQGMRYLHVFSRMNHLWDAPIAYLEKKAHIQPDSPIGILTSFRIYAQQIPTLYLLRTWELKDPSMVDQAMEHIGQKTLIGLQILQTAPQTTAAARKLLKKLQGVSLYFQIMWDSKVRTPVIVMKKSKEVQSIIERLMPIYAP